MGCGCGGRKNTNARAKTLNIGAPNAVNARQVQSQSAQRQAMVQQAKERLQQNATSPSKQVGFVPGREEMEKRRRIQISLRKRQG